MRARNGMQSVPAPLYHTDPSVTTVRAVTLRDRPTSVPLGAEDARRSLCLGRAVKRGPGTAGIINPPDRPSVPQGTRTMSQHVERRATESLLRLIAEAPPLPSMKRFFAPWSVTLAEALGVKYAFVAEFADAGANAGLLGRWSFYG
jgi:hypothetical protein